MAKKEGMPKKPPIVVICGPTGIGKTSVGIESYTGPIYAPTEVDSAGELTT